MAVMVCHFYSIRLHICEEGYICRILGATEMECGIQSNGMISVTFNSLFEL